MNSENRKRSSGTPSREVAKKPRKQIRVACNRCRSQKARCDGVRPSCRSCRDISAVCVYDTRDPTENRAQAIRREYDDLKTLQQTSWDSIDWLRSQPPDVALSCLQQLQHSLDPLQDLCSIAAVERARRLPVEIPAQEILISTSDSVRDTLTAELVTRYPASYPWILETGFVLPQARRPNLNRSLARSPSEPLNVETSSVISTWTSAGSIQSTEGPSSEGQRSIRSAGWSLRDASLHHSKIRFWTTVPIPNDLAAEIISTYLQVEHPVYGFFDSKLFLRDLLSQELQYCSPLLINSILFWSCRTFGPQYPGASVFAATFLEEAQRLLQAERNNCTALNVASLMILTIGSICFGKDQLAQGFMKAGIHMAEELCLMGEQRCTAERFRYLYPEDFSMLAHAAWGAFNLSVVLAVHFHDLNSGTFTKWPPLLPRPGSEPLSHLKHPLGESPSVRSFDQGSTFPYFCRFWCIAHEITSVFYGSSGPVHEHVPLAFAESKYRSLLEWAESLPPEARRSETMSHSAAEMHICYHATIMDLFRPFLAQGELLSTFSASPRRPEAIFMLSLAHLRALTKYYHASFSGLPESHTISWVHGPLYVAPALLRYERRDNWKADILSSLEACSDLLQSHPVIEGFLRGILGMAVSAGAFTKMQAKDCLDNLLATRQDQPPSGIPETGFVVDQDLSMESRDAAIGDALAQRFDEMLFTEDPFEVL